MNAAPLTLLRRKWRRCRARKKANTWIRKGQQANWKDWGNRDLGEEALLKWCSPLVWGETLGSPFLSGAAGAYLGMKDDQYEIASGSLNDGGVPLFALYGMLTGGYGRHDQCPAMPRWL
jgi:hypothetical protein